MPGFAVDTHEVTWGQYAACVEDGGCPPIDPERCYVYDPEQGFVLRPLDAEAIDPGAAMSCANWMDAEAMCRWQGKHLPTEAQWERAARGKGQTVHLTSDAAPTCDEAVHDGCGTAQGPSVDGRRNTIGVADLVGNLSEWTLDWYDEDAYQHPLHVRNPVGPHFGEVKVVRGGSFYDPPTFLRLSYRYGLSPQFGYDIVGFRCAR
jgi:formylglycine-generating enzyme required for sulfatase activity